MINRFLTLNRQHSDRYRLALFPANIRARSAAEEKPDVGLTSIRHRVGTRLASILCAVAAGLVVLPLALQSEGYQDWRLARLDLPALYAELKSQGESSRLLYFIGLRLNQQNRPIEADGYLREGVGLDPDSSRLRDEWARALLCSGQTMAAFGQLREFSGTHPNLADAHFNLGKFYVTQHSMVRASKEFEQAIKIEPGHMQAYLYLAEALDSLRDTERARQAAAKAVELQPRSPKARLVLASLSGRVNRPRDLVRAEFETAIALDPGSAAAHQEFARWLLDSGSPSTDRVLAMEHARRAIDLGIQDSTSYLVLGRAYQDSGNDTAAIEPLHRAASLTPDDPAPALALWQAYHRLKQDKLAIDWRRTYLERQGLMAEKNKLMQAIAIAPQDAGRKVALARWFGRHGDWAECLRNYALAKRSAIESPQVMVAASQALVQGGHTETGLPLCERAVMLARHSPDAHEALGDALLHLRRVEAAIAEYNRAIRLDPTRSDRLIERARTFVRAHREEAQFKLLRIGERITATPK